MAGTFDIACVAIVFAAILFVLERLAARPVVKREGRKCLVVSLDDGTGGRVLSCPGLGLYGRPDRILRDRETGRYIVEEIKKRQYLGKVFTGERVQLLSYMLLVRENYGSCDEGYLVYRGDVRVGPFRLDKEGEALVKWAVERVREIKQGKVPERRYSSRCKACSVRKECLETAEGAF